MKKLLILLTAVFAMSMTAKAQEWKNDHARVQAVADFLKKFRLVTQETPKYAVMNYPITYYDVYAIIGRWTNTRDVGISDVVRMTPEQQKELAEQASQLYQSKMKLELATDDKLSKAIHHRLNIQSELGPYTNATKGFYLSMSMESFFNLMTFQADLNDLLKDARLPSTFKAPAMPPRVTGRSSDGKGLIIETRDNPYHPLRQYGHVTGMQIMVLNNNTHKKHHFLIKANNWKESFTGEFSEMGINDPNDINISLYSRWYYHAIDSTYTYSEFTEKEDYIDGRPYIKIGDKNKVTVQYQNYHRNNETFNWDFTFETNCDEVTVEPLTSWPSNPRIVGNKLVVTVCYDRRHYTPNQGSVKLIGKKGDEKVEVTVIITDSTIFDVDV